jgi:type II secretory pathway pseudopilin PulG
MGKRQVRTAFTAVELLVVISIIALMAALLLPAVQWARERSRQASCSNNLRQIGIAVQQHQTLWSIFPNAGGYDANTVGAAAPWNLSRTERVDPSKTVIYDAKKQDWGWAYQILPYMEMKSNYDQPQAQAKATAVPAYFCPSRRKPTAGAIDYAGNAGYANAIKVSGKLQWSPSWPPHPPDPTMGPPSPLPTNIYAYPAANCDSFADGAIVPRKAYPANPLDPPPSDTQLSYISHRERITLADIRDGASNTILAGERWFDPKGGSSDTEDNGFVAGYTWDTIRWAYFPISNDYTTVATGGPANDDYTKFGAAHRTICHFVFCDGSTKPISYTVNPLVFQRICSRNDGTPQNEDGIGTN